MNGFKSDNVISGTWGEVWFNDQYMAETTSFSAELNPKYEDVNMPRKLISGKKMVSIDTKGEIKLKKVSSYVMKTVSDNLKEGKVPSFKIISKVSDPDANGTERVVLYGCKFDKAILADWEQGKIGEESYSFTFEDWDILDSIS